MEIAIRAAIVVLAILDVAGLAFVGSGLAVRRFGADPSDVELAALLTSVSTAGALTFAWAKWDRIDRWTWGER